MMKKISLVFALVFILAFSTTVYAGSEAINEKQTIKDDMGNYVKGIIILPEDSLSLLGYGDVTGDGVNLRAKPNTSSTILERMYYGEVVYIYYDRSGGWENGYRWLYVRREKTGTYGWAYGKYIMDWD